MNATKELEDLGKQIKLLTIKYDALVEAENKPEYPNGTPGYFGKYKYFGFLKNLTGAIERWGNHDLSGDCGLYNLGEFTPLPEAILPMPVENTGTCPWKYGDEVRVEFENGNFATDSCPTIWNWTASRPNPIVRSQLIKAAK